MTNKIDANRALLEKAQKEGKPLFLYIGDTNYRYEKHKIKPPFKLDGIQVLIYVGEDGYESRIFLKDADLREE